ncbi:HAD hydrolase-like protein [Brevibacillus reuszeri]|uniref:HAD hydrolase-like protein n=1 Tax=Brevibacillus reuszeri TaxID=54915 RepID=UPI00289CA11E|nr:HAD hydrolase-like protein [Brevibacillus reuszeri]
MRTILFDFDGTVADTLPLIFTAFRSTFQRHLNQHFSDEQIVALFGPTETEMIKKQLPIHEHEAALTHFFDVYTNEHQQLQKPAGIIRMLDAFLAAMKQLHATPEETIFVGDSDADTIAGRAAGLKTVGLEKRRVRPHESTSDAPFPSFY